MKYNLRAGDDDERQAHTRHFLKAPHYAIFLIFRMTWMAKLQNPFKSTVFFFLKITEKMTFKSANEASLHFEGTTVHLKMPTVQPDMSLLIRQKMVKNAKCDI